MASEVEQGYWTSESDSSDGPTGLFVDLRGGEYRPNHRTAIREALEAELAASGFEFTDDRLGSGLRPQDYDARSRALFEEYADWSPDVDRDMVYRDAGKPAPGGSPAFGGPWRHRDPGWIPVDEWFARQEDSRAYDGVPGSDAHLSYISKRL